MDGELDAAGRLANRVVIGVHDQGFAPDPGLPLGRNDRQAELPGLDPLQAAEACAPGTGRTCSVPPWAFRTTGSALRGTARPVAIPRAFYREGDIFTASDELVAMYLAGTRIINMSWGGMTPAAATVFTAPFDAITTSLSPVGGAVLFAAAGNARRDVDAEDCFILCWEEGWQAPCENRTVVCVGALALDSDARASYSNWGLEDVDIFAPGTVLVADDPQLPALGNYAR